MKIFEGIVKSIPNTNTAVVVVERLVPHPVYRKLMRRSSSFKTHIQEGQVKIGEKVKIVETRPISKDKNFKIFENKKEKPIKSEVKK